MQKNKSITKTPGVLKIKLVAPLIVLLISFIAIIILILLLFSLWKGLGLPVPMNQATTRTGKQLFQIADEYFLIPRNYIWIQKNRLKVDGVHIHTFYPEMPPYTEQTKALIDEIGWVNGKISLLVHYAVNPKITAKVLAIVEEYLQKGRLRKMDALIEGFTVYHPVYLGKVKHGRKEYLIGKLDNGKDFILKCMPLDEKVPGFDKIYPSCSTTILLTPRVIIKYTFQRDLLPQWREINQKIVELVERFRQEGARYAVQNLKTGEY